MSRASWVVDPSRFATKIKSASGDPEDVNWKSNPAIVCPKCKHAIDNSDASQKWPGLPKGVKFDPSDQEIVEHLLAKVGMKGKPHPFIEEFITTVDKEDGICYTHPQNLPGVKKDGTASHFFHRAIKAYNTGTRKRRKIHGEDFGDLRWHKTGRTKPVIVDGVQRGCKKIMVLYVSMAKGGKSEKTNWVMHQYHLGMGEDEKDGEYVISKVFYQQQVLKHGDKGEQEYPECSNVTETTVAVKADPVTPKSVTPDPPRVERQFLNSDHEQDMGLPQPAEVFLVEEVQSGFEDPNYRNYLAAHNHADQMEENNTHAVEYHADQMEENDTHAEENSKWWEGESQDLLDSQQLVEGLSLCDEFLQSQSPSRGENVDGGRSKDKPHLSDYAQLGPEHLKQDLEECQNMVFDPANIELDTPPEFRLSQLEFGSQDSFLAWGGSKVVD